MSKILRLLNIGEFNSLNDSLPLVAGMIDNRGLSKIHASGQPFRYLLAFFVPKFRLLSQSGDNKAQTHLPQFAGVNRHIMPALAKSYGGVTLQNKPLRQICEAVACVTESEPRHPMILHSVVNTQNNTQGGIIMPYKIIMPAGNIQISQRKNTFAHSATDSTAHTQTDLQRQIDRLESRYSNDLRLNLERLKMLEAVIDDVAHALSFIKSNTSKHLTEPLSTGLGIGQLLAMDFIQSLSDDIAELEGKA
nr:hypothetical protein [Moraxella sp. CTOTU47915]